MTFLAHHGVQGMKWGVRNAETQRKYAAAEKLDMKYSKQNEAEIKARKDRVRASTSRQERRMIRRANAAVRNANYESVLKADEKYMAKRIRSGESSRKNFLGEDQLTLHEDWAKYHDEQRRKELAKLSDMGVTVKKTTRQGIYSEYTGDYDMYGTGVKVTHYVIESYPPVPPQSSDVRKGRGIVSKVLDRFG